MKAWAAIFDLDGTLLNSLADIARAANEILRLHGYAVHPVEAYAQMVGNGFEILIKRALAPHQPADMANLVAEARDYYAAHMMEKTEPYAGMGPALQNLAQKGAALAVLSNKPDKLSGILIKHYFPSIPFQAIIGAREGVPLKPDPHSLLALLAQLNILPQNCFYVGDSNVDMQTARNAGAHGVGAGWGFRGRLELENAGAQIVLDMPEELRILPEI